MKKVFLLVILFSTYLCRAQNYQCLQSGVKHYFTNGNGYLRGIRIDSTRTIGSDTVYYPYHTFRYPISAAMDSTNGSWLGSRVIQQPDGTFLFNTVWKDTVVIKTQANPGDSWVLYNDTSSKYYIAKVTATDTMSVLGVLDSVKDISITAYSGLTIDSTDPINYFEMILSKNNGFVKTFDLYDFPYHAPDSIMWIDWYVSYIAGSGYLGSAASIGSFSGVYAFSSVFSIVPYNPTQLEIYNFSVGDAFYRQVYANENGSYDPIDNRYAYDSIIGKTIIDPYHVEYNVYEWYYDTHYYYDPPPSHYATVVTYFNSNTVTFTADTSFVINLVELPEEIGTSDSAYFYLPNDTQKCFRSPYYSVIKPVVFEGCPQSRTYKGGFLDFAYKNYTIDPTDPTVIGCSTFISMSTLFSIKDGTYCGSHPDRFLTVNELAKNEHLILYPNPANTTLAISCSAAINTVAISNVIGQTIYSHNYNTDKVEVNVAGLPAGVYFVKINGTEVRKFVKE